MISFHGKKEIKDLYIGRVLSHELADVIVKGRYWQNGKGCAVGCTIHGSDHAKYETELGIPRVLAFMEDAIFESLPNRIAKTWPREFLESIGVGKDLKNIWPNFACWLLVDEKYGVINFAKTEEQKNVIQKISDLYSTNDKFIQQEWIDAFIYACKFTSSGNDPDNAIYTAIYCARSMIDSKCFFIGCYCGNVDSAHAATSAMYCACRCHIHFNQFLLENIIVIYANKLLQLLRECE
jgi:hypothetical protein